MRMDERQALGGFRPRQMRVVVGRMKREKEVVPRAPRMIARKGA